MNLAGTVRVEANRQGTSVVGEGLGQTHTKKMFDLENEGQGQQVQHL